MATFYGRTRGNRGDATRTGSYDSHIASSVQSYDGSLTMELFYPTDEDGTLGGDKYIDTLWVQVYHNEGSGIFGDTVFRGSVERFLDMCRREFE